MSEVKPQEPWQWPEEHWRKLVNQVREGPKPPTEDVERWGAMRRGSVLRQRP